MSGRPFALAALAAIAMALLAVGQAGSPVAGDRLPSVGSPVSIPVVIFLVLLVVAGGVLVAVGAARRRRGGE